MYLAHSPLLLLGRDVMEKGREGERWLVRETGMASDLTIIIYTVSLICKACIGW